MFENFDEFHPSWDLGQFDTPPHMTFTVDWVLKSNYLSISALLGPKYKAWEVTPQQWHGNITLFF